MATSLHHGGRPLDAYTASETPRLQALLLVIRNRSGPARIIASYPSSPDDIDGEGISNGQKQQVEEEDEDDAASAVDVSSIPASTTQPSELAFDGTESERRTSRDEEPSSAVEESRLLDPSHTARSTQTPPRNKKPKGRAAARLEQDDSFFGQPKESLAKLLIPGSVDQWHLKKLDIRLRGHTFIGCPVTCRPIAWSHDGKAPDSPNKNDAGDVLQRSDSQGALFEAEAKSEEASSNTHAGEEQQGHNASQTEPIPISKKTSAESARQDTVEPSQQHLEPHSVQSGISIGSLGSETERRLNPLIAFNIVGVFACTAQSSDLRSERYFRHIANPLAKWLKRAQDQYGWVDRQARRLEQFYSTSAGAWAGGKTIQGRHEHWFGGPSVPLESSVHSLLEEVFDGVRQDRTIQLGSDRHGVSPLIMRLPKAATAVCIPSPTKLDEHALTSVALRSTSLSTSGQRWTASKSKSGQKHDAATSLANSADYRDSMDLLGIESDEPSAISPHAAIVLLKGRKALLDRLANDITDSSAQGEAGRSPVLESLRHTPVAQALNYFVRNLSYRRTLMQLTQPTDAYQSTSKDQKQASQSTMAPAMPGLTLRDAQFLACILIRVGEARTTFPLHASNCYVVNPAAPTSELQPHATQWALRFGEDDTATTNITLPEMLQKLSNNANPDTHRVKASTTHTRPWATLIPSKDQKDTYMNMLAWLVARNWVIQIRTFAFIKVSSEVKRAVRAGTDDTTKEQTTEAKPHEPFDARPHRSMLSALVNRSRPSSAAGSATSTRTAVKAPGSNASRKSSRDELTKQTSNEPEHEDVEFTPSLIQSPRDASTQEQAWIDYIGEHLRDAESRRVWTTLVGYLDGQHALEEVAAMEGWKRASLAGVVKCLVAEDLVRTVRHW